jgi:putative membrane protein
VPEEGDRSGSSSSTGRPEAAAPAAATAPEAAPAAAGPIDITSSVTAPNSTEGLIKGVTLTDMYQIQAGKIAEAKGQSPGVKDFGKMMVTDHTAMSNQMKHLFAATKLPIPTELGPRGKGMIDALNAASPADFDKLYLDQQQAAQQAELALLQGYADNGESTDIKPRLQKRSPRPRPPRQGPRVAGCNEIARLPPQYGVPSLPDCGASRSPASRSAS